MRKLARVKKIASPQSCGRLARGGLRVFVTSLGCPKNRVDTERLLGSLGMPIKFVNSADACDLIFINTCAFIEPAVRESIRAILDAAPYKSKTAKKPLLAVAGCLTGRYAVAELHKELPEVDLWLTPDNQPAWSGLLMEQLGRRPMDRAPYPGRIHTTFPSFAWLKIADGCSHKCAFCAIPNIKGPYVCEPRQRIMAEAQYLLGMGVKELVLVAQDVASWRDNALFDDKNGMLRSKGLASLLEDLAPLPGLRWLRLLYLYPHVLLSSQVLQAMAQIGSPILPYLDIPLQHSEKEILQKMGRPFAVDGRHILEEIRKALPHAALRTSIIVGFPGETDSQFERLCDFVREARFYNLGVFTYYAEDGTKAADYPDQIPDDVKEARKAELMDIQAEISEEILSSYADGRMDVLVDEPAHAEWPGLYKGRVWFQAPEIDGITYISGPGVETGQMLQADIVETKIYDLVALA